MLVPLVWLLAGPHVQTPEGPVFDPVRIVEPSPPIVAAPILKASQVRHEVAGSELVLGIVLDSEARAYPINMLTGPSREIINDRLAGKAIAATW